MSLQSQPGPAQRLQRLRDLMGAGKITRSEAPLRTSYTIEPPRTMRAAGFEWDHEIRVALPPSYPHTDFGYPVLWVTDNNLEQALAAADGLLLTGAAPELILVGIGGDATISGEEFQRRRTYDFSPTEELYFDGPQGADLLRRRLEQHPEGPSRAGGAGPFLDFLVDDVRTALAQEYRMDPSDHGLVGMSGGGMFVGYAMFARPDAFRRYICGSPSLNAGNFKIFEMEEQYAAGHDDFDAHMFFGAGEGELTEDFIASWACLSCMGRLVETLAVRRYPSLKLTARIFPSETHGTVWPLLLRHGIAAVWADQT